MTMLALKTADLQLRNRVLQQLASDAQVNASEIGVTAHDNVATLTGLVDTYAGKLAAERAAKRVPGIRAVANDLGVRLRLPRTDPDIATDAARALNERQRLPDSVQAVVHDGHITLTGIVPSLYQKVVAEHAVRYIDGVRGVVNRIQVMAPSSPREVRRAIVRAMHQDADVHAERIHVSVSGDRVVLAGQVESSHERDAAGFAAAHVPGITHVENMIAVQPSNVGTEEAEIC